MAEFSEDFVDKIALSCIQLYNTLPKVGKAIEDEWTVLSCVIQFDKNSNKYDVVALGTGTKCIGASKMLPDGTSVNDSHAEVFARRGFLLYLYENIEKAITVKPGQESIFVQDGDRYKLRENLEFIFYSSQLPCGDASIVDRVVKDDYGKVISSLKRKTDDNDNVESKNQIINAPDIHRTGAKCLPHCEQDPREPGTNYHLLGQVRTKPGRGDRSLSVSCSDKIARWIHVGIQGALLDMLLTEPIYIKYFIFGSGVPYSLESLTRALLRRSLPESKQPIAPVIPKFYQSTAVFHVTKSEIRKRPAPGSLVIVNCGIIEVAVQGKRLGVTKKKAHLKTSALCISKYNIYRRFIEILRKNTNIQNNFLMLADDDLKEINYNEMKRKSERYYKAWDKVKESFFKTWTKKPDMWSFNMSNQKETK